MGVLVAWDCSCLEEVCGACTMVINGRVRQACSALIEADQCVIRCDRVEPRHVDTVSQFELQMGGKMRQAQQRWPRTTDGGCNMHIITHINMSMLKTGEQLE